MLSKPTLLAALSLLAASLSSAAPVIPNPAAAVPGVVNTVGSGVLSVTKDAVKGGLGRRGLPIVEEVLGGGDEEGDAGGIGSPLGRRQFGSIPIVGGLLGGLLGGGNQNKPPPTQPSVPSSVPSSAPPSVPPSAPSSLPTIVPPPAENPLGRRQFGSIPIVGGLLGGLLGGGNQNKPPPTQPSVPSSAPSSVPPSVPPSAPSSLPTIVPPPAENPLGRRQFDSIPIVGGLLGGLLGGGNQNEPSPAEPSVPSSVPPSVPSSVPSSAPTPVPQPAENPLGPRQFDSIPIVGDVLGGLLGGGNQNEPSPAEPSVPSSTPSSSPSSVPTAEGVAGGLERREGGLPIVGDLLGDRGEEAPSPARATAPESELESKSGSKLTPEHIEDLEGIAPSRMVPVCLAVCKPVKPVCEAGEVASGTENCWGCCVPASA